MAETPAKLVGSERRNQTWLFSVIPSVEKVGFVCWNAALWTPFVVRKQNISREQFISSWSGSLHLVSRIRSEKCCFCQLNIKLVQTSSMHVDNGISADDSCLLTRSFRLRCKSNGKDVFQLHLKQRSSLPAITLLLEIVAEKNWRRILFSVNRCFLWMCWKLVWKM